MPKSTSPTSNEADAGPSDDRFVLDFLYYDSRRIASYLSQFDPDGHLQRVRRGKTGSRGKRDTSTREAKGKVPGLAEGTYASGIEELTDLSQGYEREFDPLWSNARTFLDHLSENDMLGRDMGIAQIGQFVLATGYLTVLDLTMMKAAWQLNSIKNAVRKGVVQSPQAGNAAKEQKENAQLIVDLIQIMPHAVNATLITSVGEAYQLWCALQEEFMATPASEVVMTHGNFVQGDWTIVGVLSALPDMTGLNGFLNPQQNGTEFGIINSIVGQASSLLAPMVRVAMGRPANAYAVTPLLIYRKIATAQEGLA